MQKFKVDEALRVDLFVAKALQKSRAQVTQLIKNKGLMINGKICEKSAVKLKIGDELEILKFPPQNITPKYSANFNISVLYEDEDLLVISKPAGVVVHSAPSVKEATLVDWLLAKGYALSTLGGQVRAGLVHRLDKGTSGALIIAKNNFTHERLASQLLDKTLGRFYLALTNLPLKNDTMLVEKALIRSPKNRLKKLAVSAGVRGAKEAKSAFVNVLCGKNLAPNSQNKANLIAAKLFTGRTHQIRAHLESLNRHILGDVLYGYKGKDYERVMLHSYFLHFKHPRNEQKLIIKAPLYDDFMELLKDFDKGELDEKLSFDDLQRTFAACAECL